MISNVPELLKPLFVCMGVVKANDVIDFCYSPDLSHLNEDEQHVWGYHWNGLSLVIFPTQHVWKKFLNWVSWKSHSSMTKYFIIPLLKKCLNTSPTLFHVLCMSSKHNEQETQTPHTHTVPLGVCSSSS